MTQDTTYGGPFSQAAQIYRAAGWRGTLPLGNRRGEKHPPPGGWTGHGAPYPSAADVAAWQETHGDRNIGLRMPPGVLGLDVDAYPGKRGAEELARLESEFGPLPATWVSSARPAPSGIRFYRVPEQLDGCPINWPGEAGKHIEIIQPGHRYAVVWPSTNPHAAGAPYEWRHDDGLGLPRAGEFPPQPGELAALPDAWVRGLALAYERSDKAVLGTPAMNTWWEQLRGGATCPPVHRVWTKAVEELRDVDGSRHETARDAVAALVRFGGAGHRGAVAAVARVAEAFEASVGAERVANGEWTRLVAGAVQIAAGENPRPRQQCEHDPATRLDAALIPDFEVPGAATAPPSGTAPAPGAPTLADQGASLVDALVADINALPADERDDAVRAAARDLVLAGAGEAQLQRARAELTRKSGLSEVGLTEFAELLRAAKRERKELHEHQRLLERHAAAQAAVEARRQEGRILPPPNAPIDVARALAGQLPAPARWWRGDFYRWDGTRYVAWRDEAVDNWIYGRTADAFYDPGDDKPPTPWRPNSGRLGDVAHALSRGVLYRPSEDETDDGAQQVACRNGIFDVTRGELLPHTPDRFNLVSVPFDYDPSATAPTWEAFLAQALPADARRFLAQWVGYLISGRTDLEKIASFVGPPRSGKGTIITAIEALLGGENVSSPSVPSLVGSFGEQPLIGKSLAVFSDISWQHRDIVTAVEILKAISGQDTRDVNRKNREVWHGKLGVRFMVVGNDLPRFTDASGALAGRLIHVQFLRSMAGQEDPTLKSRILAELPGILNWALAGLRDLQEVGRFSVPQTSETLAGEVRRQQSPVQGFLDDLCAFSEEANPVPLDELHPVYQQWAKDADVEHRLDRERFSRALTSAGLRVERKMINGVRARRVHGIVPQVAPDGRSAWVATLLPLVIPPLQT